MANDFGYRRRDDWLYLRKSDLNPPELLTATGWELRDSDYAYRDWFESVSVTAEEVRLEEERLAAAAKPSTDPGQGEVA